MQKIVVRGIVREGLVVPEGDDELPEGAIVEIHVVETSKIDAEAERWRRMSEDSWATIAWGQS